MVSVFSSSIINTATVFLHLLDNDFLSLGGFPGRQEIIQRCILIKNVFLGIVNQAFGNEFAIPIYVLHHLFEETKRTRWNGTSKSC